MVQVYQLPQLFSSSHPVVTQAVSMSWSYLLITEMNEL
jgi:hypothetical protein